jgi:esterase/lipase superfamily enzyme
MPDRYLRLPSRTFGRPVHLWCHGFYGQPVLVFPSAAGMAHEWQIGGAIEALGPLLRAGRIKLYCVESNVSRSWLSDDASPAEKLALHHDYERFVLDELVPFIDDDCRTPGIPLISCGVSFGGFYALNFALKNPGVFRHALCLSGRYDVGAFLPGERSPEAWYNQPLAYVPGLKGAALSKVREQTGFTLVVGQGPHEGRCVGETLNMAAAMRQVGLRVKLDVWGHDVSHEWVWWRRQLRHHLGLLAG